ncbi:MAG: hypothetical protein WC742_12530 [Gallionellaceae bacterium]|jgi:hypothetical protein
MTEALLMPAQQCALCDKDAGVYDFDRVCCVARFVCSIPIKALRKGWMERFKAQNGAGAHTLLECAVKARWALKKGSGDMKESNGAN